MNLQRRVDPILMHVGHVREQSLPHARLAWSFGLVLSACIQSGPPGAVKKPPTPADNSPGSCWGSTDALTQPANRLRRRRCGLDTGTNKTNGLF